MAALITAKPWMTGRSRDPMAPTMYRPVPGQVKTVSTMAEARATRRFDGQRVERWEQRVRQGVAEQDAPHWPAPGGRAPPARRAAPRTLPATRHGAGASASTRSPAPTSPRGARRVGGRAWPGQWSIAGAPPASRAGATPARSWACWCRRAPSRGEVIGPAILEARGQQRQRQRQGHRDRHAGRGQEQRGAQPAAELPLHRLLAAVADAHLAVQETVHPELVLDVERPVAAPARRRNVWTCSGGELSPAPRSTRSAGSPGVKGSSDQIRSVIPNSANTAWPSRAATRRITVVWLSATADGRRRTDWAPVFPSAVTSSLAVPCPWSRRRRGCRAVPRSCQSRR